MIIVIKIITVFAILALVYAAIEVGYECYKEIKEFEND